MTYNLYRLIMIDSEYSKMLGSNLFFAGYTYGVLYSFLMKNIPSTFYRIWVVIFAYLLRYGIMIFVIDRKAFQAGAMIRGFITDIFIVYYFHSGDFTDRKVYMKFDEKREELLQFKELLADSLPVGITVVDYKTLKPLFSNRAFVNLFKNHQAIEEAVNEINSPRNQAEREENEITLNYLSQLHADETTIRDMGKGQPDMRPSNLKSNLICLEGVLQNITKENLLAEKDLSLTASESCNINPRSFEVILKRIRWSGNDAIAVVLNDITYQEKLMHWKLANANKDRIIATVSHELRTPLNGIIGLLDMTEKRIEHSEALEYISLCKDNAHLLLNLVNSLLDLHQISAGKLKLNFSKVNIRKCFQDVIRLFQFQSNQKGISLTLSTSEEVPTHINTDESRLKQIIINLIGNAIKFTFHGGIKVTIRGNPEEPCYLVVSVTDTGMGIHEEDMNKLFQMFGKLEDGESVNTHGIGLGLTISNALAVMLSGKRKEREIKVTSQYGMGSSFTFNILKDLKSDLNIEPKSSKNSDQKILKLKEENNDPEEQISLRVEKLYFPSNLEFEDLESGDSRQKDEISDISVNLDTKLEKYKTLSRIDISRLNSQSQFNDSQTPIIIKKDSDQKDEPQRQNTLYFASSQQSIQGPTKGVVRKKSRFASGGNLSKEKEDSHILIVDDNPFNLLVAENLVKETGYTVKTASGGHEAIRKIEEFANQGQAVKVILMDCQMPVIDGYETTKILIEMMNNGKIPKVPILALTANNSKEDIKRCYDSGMVGHLTKPTSKKALVKALSKLDE